MDESIKCKYTAVKRALDEAITDAQSVQLYGEEESAELDAVLATLEGINQEFHDEVEKLESASEWDKYCIAFFGETNAGKSTIIESLRIINNEEQRRIEIAKQKASYTEDLEKHCEEYRNILEKLKELNTAIVNHKQPSKLQKGLFYAGLILSGIIIGCLIAYFVM